MNINKDHVNVPPHVVVPMKENLITKNHLYLLQRYLWLNEHNRYFIHK